MIKRIIQDYNHIASKFGVIIITSLLFILNIAFRIAQIDFHSLYGDEPFSLYYAQHTVPQIIEHLSTGNNPPFYEVLLHYWIKLFGISEASLRMPSVLFASISSIYIFRIGREIKSTQHGIIGALLFTLSTLVLSYSQQGRTYSLLILLGTVSSYHFIKTFISNSQKPLDQVMFVLSAALMVYVHYFGAIHLLSMLVFSITSRTILKSRRTQLIWTGSAILIISSPIVYQLAKRFLITAETGSWIRPVENLGPLLEFMRSITNGNDVVLMLTIFLGWLSIQRLANSLENKNASLALIAMSTFFMFYCLSIISKLKYFWRFSDNPIALLAFLAFTILLYTLLRMFLKGKREKESLIIHLAFFPLLIFFFTSYWFPVWEERYLVFTTPYIYLSLALIPYTLGRQLAKSAITLLLFAFAMTSSSISTKGDKAIEVVEHVKNFQKTHPESIVFLSPPFFDLNFAYYYDREGFEISPKNQSRGGLKYRLSRKNIHLLYKAAEIPENLPKHILFVDAGTSFIYKENGIQEHLDESSSLFNTSIIGGKYKLLHYVSE